MIKENELIGLKYNVKVEAENIETGEVEEIKVHNLVTNLGKQLIRDFLIKESVDGLNYIAIGTDNTAPVVGNTTLGAEVFRDIFTDVLVDGNKVTFKYFLSSTDANSNTLVEAGLFGNDATVTVNSGLLFAHVIHAPIEKNSAVAITYSWEITIS